MKLRLITAALAVLALSAPAAAQDYRQDDGYGPGGLPPHEIVTILRSTGLDPLGQPMRRGPYYVMRAIDGRDREVRVMVSARSGEVLSVTPVQTASRIPPPGAGLTWGPYERMPPGSMPPSGYRGGAPIVDEDDEPNISGNPNAPRPPAVLPGAPSRSSNAAPLPPRGGAMQPDYDDAAPPSEPRVILADPDRSGMLPPPPERFPQRAAPAAKRAAAAPPQQAPLPRPKPAVKFDAPPPAPQAAPQSPPQNSPAAEDTPH